MIEFKYNKNGELEAYENGVKIGKMDKTPKWMFPNAFKKDASVKPITKLRFKQTKKFNTTPALKNADIKIIENKIKNFFNSPTKTR